MREGGGERRGKERGRRGEDERRGKKEREKEREKFLRDTENFQASLLNRHHTITAHACANGSSPSYSRAGRQTPRGGEVTSQQPRWSDGWSGPTQSSPGSVRTLQRAQRHGGPMTGSMCWRSTFSGSGCTAQHRRHSIYHYMKLICWVHLSTEYEHCLVAPLSTGEDIKTSHAP